MLNAKFRKKIGWCLSESLVPVTINYWAYIFGLMNAKLNSSGAGSASHFPVSPCPLPLCMSSCARWLVSSKWGELGTAITGGRSPSSRPSPQGEGEALPVIWWIGRAQFRCLPQRVAVRNQQRCQLRTPKVFASHHGWVVEKRIPAYSRLFPHIPACSRISRKHGGLGDEQEAKTQRAWA
jgi:hypothetical protein